MIEKWKRPIKYILLTYISSGLLYSMAGYIYRSIIGKENVLSLLIGIPYKFPLFVFDICEYHSACGRL
jgi:polyferredoxin